VVCPDSIAFAASPGASALSTKVSTLTPNSSTIDDASQRAVARTICIAALPS
jgi:hypothetical protein